MSGNSKAGRRVNLLELVKILNTYATLGKRIFTLSEISLIGGVSQPAAGMALLRGQRGELVIRVGKLWVNRLNPPPLIDIAFNLTPSYLSFESALYKHGILSQSPRGALTLATTGRPRRIETPWGAIQFTHLKKDLFFGFDSERIAYPEKAWLDLIYIRNRKEGKLEYSETWYLESLNKKRVREFAKNYPSWVQRDGEGVRS